MPGPRRSDPCSALVDVPIEEIEKRIEIEVSTDPQDLGTKEPVKKETYGRETDEAPDEVTLDDFNQQQLRNDVVQKHIYAPSNKDRLFDAKIAAYEQRRKKKYEEREQELYRRRVEKRLQTLKYVATFQWLNFSAKCRDNCKCCGRSTTMIICIVVTVALVVGTPIVITIFTGGLA
ncbi:hypothetical protein AAMO2058_001243200 [Amorphochlora amoebiformis]